MPRPARSTVYDPTQHGVYHCFNRTTRRSYLHGVDPLTGVDHSHRREWFRARMKFLIEKFCLDLLSYAIRPNHWHCVIRNRHDLVEQMSDRQVAIRWLSITSRKPTRGNKGGKIRECEIDAILSEPEHVKALRVRLSDISWFVKLMCQTVARKCNIEDECTGHFFEERFKLNALEEQEHVLACMAYVDLNPLKAHLVDSLDDPSAMVSIRERLETLDGSAVDTSDWLSPIELFGEADGLPVAVVNDLTLEEVQERRRQMEKDLGCVPMTFASYVNLLWQLAIQARPNLQSHPALTAEQMREVCWRNGQAVDVDGLREQIKELRRRSNADLGGHALIASMKFFARNTPSRKDRAGAEAGAPE